MANPTHGMRAIVGRETYVGEAEWFEGHGWYWAGSDPTDYVDGKIRPDPTHWQPLPLPTIR